MVFHRGHKQVLTAGLPPTPRNGEFWETVASVGFAEKMIIFWISGRKAGGSCRDNAASAR